MNKKILIRLNGCLVVSVFVVVALYALSDSMVHKPNSFMRIIPSHAIAEETTLDLKYNSYYIAGTAKDHIYFGNTTGPLHLLVSNLALTDTQHVRLSIKNMDSLKFKTIHVNVDSPYFYIMDGVMPGLFRGKVNEWIADRFMYDSTYFSAATPIGHTSFALRTTSRSLRQDVLAKETYNGVNYFPGLLEKQLDGIFCVDGMLDYNKELNRLIYTYYYRNQFIVMDTNLNLQYRGTTIDTISHAQIQTDTIISKNSFSYTMSKPPLMVNKKSCTYGNWLFVNSDLLAKNENPDAFAHNSVIDVYDLTNGGIYLFSFYIAEYDRIKMREFQFVDHHLYAMFDRYVIRYQLNDKFFSELSIEKQNL